MIEAMIEAMIEFLQELREQAQIEEGNPSYPEYDFEFNHTI